MPDLLTAEPGRFHQEHALKQDDVRTEQFDGDTHHAGVVGQGPEQLVVAGHPEEFPHAQFHAIGLYRPPPHGGFDLYQFFRHVRVPVHDRADLVPDGLDLTG